MIESDFFKRNGRNESMSGSEQIYDFGLQK